MSDPWKIVHFKRLAPSDPDFIWANFDVKFNGASNQSDVKLLQEGDIFRLSNIEASSQTLASITQEALDLALRTVPQQ